MITEQQLCPGIAENEMNGGARKLEAHRHSDKTGAHNTEISRNEFHAIGGENGNSISAHEPPSRQRTRDGIGHGIEVRIGEFTRALFAGEIDNCHFVRIKIAANEIAEIVETCHSITVNRQSRLDVISESQKGFNYGLYATM